MRKKIIIIFFNSYVNDNDNSNNNSNNTTNNYISESKTYQKDASLACTAVIK